MNLADPNPVLFILGTVIAIFTIVMAVLYVRIVNANGKAAAEFNRIEAEAASHD